LTKKLTQKQFIHIVKDQNHEKTYDTGTDFNYTDIGYVTHISHDARMNKRALTAKPKEQFGDFTKTLFNFDGQNTEIQSLN